MNLHGLLIVDKPAGLTSHDVVSRVRRLLRTRKVGHAGTLDPAAEGVLVVAVGRATKLLAFLSGSSKEYAAHIVLGVGSDSGDIEGPAAFREHIRVPAEQVVRQALAHFLGEIEQIPPAHAAIKVDGEALYRRARRGEAVDAPARRIHIESLELLAYRYPDLFLRIECSAGTYIRALARDVGDRLETGAYLHYLLRTRVGEVDLHQTWPMERLEHELRPESFAQFAVNPGLVLPGMGAIALDSAALMSWYDGRSVPARESGGVASTVSAFGDDGSWLGTGNYEPDLRGYQPRLVVHD